MTFLIPDSRLPQALSKHNTPQITYPITALTRSPTSTAAQQLASLPGVSLLQVDADVMDHPEKAFQSIKAEGEDVWGVFSVQGYVADDVMIRQGGFLDRMQTGFLWESVGFRGVGAVDGRQAGSLE